jgi:3-hydroxyacyl-[acyl-carrier-protein] dehydratase
MADKSQNISLDIKQILELLPHRFPFLLVDRVLEMDLDKKVITAQKNVSFNESFFQGHFPNAPIMPGVLILEALAQTGAILAHYDRTDNKVAILLSATNVKFRQPVRPGDILILKVEFIHLGSKAGRVQATAFVNEKVVVDAEIGVVFVDKDQI